MGAYAVTAPPELLTAAKHERHPTELARLHGARLVVATETERGGAWAEAKIKWMTGDDRIVARFMGQDFFEYDRQFKLLVSGNHRPSLSGVDEAIRRRIHLIPFRVTIPPDERDERLPEKLRAEWDGIMAWGVEGRAWLREGLNPPEAVREATDAYLAAQDAFTAWAEECCDADPGAFESAAALYVSWRNWAERSGEIAGEKRGFSETLEARGLRRDRRNKLRGYFGLRLRPTDYGDTPW
jgi:putative DNA primase/helicase